MTSETTIWSAEECPFSECERGGFLGGLFRRLFATRNASARRPGTALPHPLERLSFHDGTLWEVSEHGHAREYLALSGVEVIAKRSFRERQDGGCEYRFELNMIPDSAWRFYFAEQGSPVSLEFDGREMVLICPPDDLERSYGGVKARMELANEAYAREREGLISRVVAREARMAAAREADARRATELKRAFDGLQL